MEMEEGEEEEEEKEKEAAADEEEEEEKLPTVNFHITTDNITIVCLISFNLVYYCVINCNNVQD